MQHIQDDDAEPQWWHAGALHHGQYHG